MKKAAILGTAAILLAGIWAPAQAQQKFNESLSVSKQTAAAAKRSQQRINDLDTQTAALLNDYRANVKQLEAALRYNESLKRNIKAQEEEKVRIREDLENVSVLQRAMQPLMEDMVGDFNKMVAADVPFLEGERAARGDRLNGLLNDPGMSAAQRYRLIVEAYQIENEYGRTIGAYEGKIEGDKGEVLTGEFLRVGRMALIFKTPDDSVLNIYDPAQGKFVKLDRGYLQDVKFGLRMAKEQTAPDIFFIPVKAPAAAN